MKKGSVKNYLLSLIITIFSGISLFAVETEEAPLSDQAKLVLKS